MSARRQQATPIGNKNTERQDSSCSLPLDDASEAWLEVKLQLQKEIMNTIVRKMLLPAFAALGVLLAGGSLSTASAQQSSEDRVIDQAQRAVRQRIITQEGGRNLTVLFNTDAQTDNRSRSEVRVRGTGSFSRTNDSRYSNQRDNNRRSRDFSYEATVNNRTR